ncbi:MAG: hypothetical protein Q8K58_09380 [Acidimicrobiales bacterium]|nr:hypothetical protein [Acidimicrobiales bacterium]
MSLILLVVVVAAGIVIGTVLNREDEPDDEEAVVVAEGTIGAVAWRVDAVRDVEGDTCAFLFQDGAQLTGSCDVTPQDATIGDATVVFGQAPSGAETVRVELDDGEVVDIDTQDVEGFDTPFYVTTVDGDVDAAALVGDR